MPRVIVPISLPKELNLKIEKRLKKNYASKSEYVRELVREDLDREELERERKKYPKFYEKLDRDLKKGLEDIKKGRYSGPFTAKETIRFLDSIGKTKTKK